MSNPTALRRVSPLLPGFFFVVVAACASVVIWPLVPAAAKLTFFACGFVGGVSTGAFVSLMRRRPGGEPA